MKKLLAFICLAFGLLVFSSSVNTYADPIVEEWFGGKSDCGDEGGWLCAEGPL